MASDVDICNNALGLLGDPGTIVSISPASGSAEAVHCARFYPIARDSLINMHSWGFATKRVNLALLADTPPSSWQYVYQSPADVLNYLAVFDPNASDDYSSSYPQAGSLNASAAYSSMVGVYTPQQFAVELDANGVSVIYTNQQNAILKYSARVTDTSLFDPLFSEALTWLLAAKLAGPLIKGSEGRAASRECLQEFKGFLAMARESDSNSHRQHVAPSTDWIVNR